MTANRRPKNEKKDIMKQVLDFGPDKTPTDFSERAKEIIKKLQEISRRIDHLASRF